MLNETFSVIFKHRAKDGSSISSLMTENASARFATDAYYEFTRVSGYIRSGFSNSLTLDDFQTNYALYGFDISSSGEAYADFLIPSTR